MNDVALLMQSYDSVKAIQASMESQPELDIYHDHLAFHAVEALRTRHPGLPQPSMEGFGDMLGSLGNAISQYWNGQLESQRELHAYRAGTHPTQAKPNARVVVEGVRVCNPVSEAVVMGMYGTESALVNGALIMTEAERLIHAARDLLQTFKVNKLIREATADNPFTLRVQEQALRINSVSRFNRVFGAKVFESFDVGPLMFSTPRFTDAFTTKELMKDFRKKFEADGVKVSFSKPEQTFIKAKALIEIESPEFIRIMNNIEERMTELTHGKSKFEDPDFAFDDDEIDTLAYVTWDSVRHVAVTLYSFAYNNALALYHTLSKVEV